jgi:hypothetical protein
MPLSAIALPSCYSPKPLTPFSQLIGWHACSPQLSVTMATYALEFPLSSTPGENVIVEFRLLQVNLFSNALLGAHYT